MVSKVCIGRTVSKMAGWNQTVGGGRDLSHYRDRPEDFMTEVLGLYLTQEQRLILRSLIKNEVTNVKACHGVGKSFLAAHIVLYWVFAHGGMAITTAPTFDQVKEVLWREIRKAYAKHKRVLGGYCLTINLHLSESCKAFGISTRNYDTNSFQGKHDAALLLILDEACGISRTIDEAADACMTGAENRLMRFGNPVAAGNAFEESCRDFSIQINAWNHPNVSWAYEVHEDGIHRLKPAIAKDLLDERGRVRSPKYWPEKYPQDKIPGAISVSWIERIRRKYGEASHYWQSRVEAEFPSENQQSLVPRNWFLEARVRYDEWLESLDGKTPELMGDWTYGLDIGDGHDPHAMAAINGKILLWVDEMKTRGDRRDPNRAASWGTQVLIENPGLLVWDEIGPGTGAGNLLLENLDEDRGLPEDEQEMSDCSCHPARWGGKPKLKRDRRSYNSNKAKQCWKLREAFRNGEIMVAPLGEKEELLMEELSTMLWDTNNSGQITIEKMEITREKLGRSTNLADAVIMAYTGQWRSRGITL